MQLLNWRDKYPGFPNLPFSKLWLDEEIPGEATYEQIISKKLFLAQPITSKESNILFDSVVYYNKLFQALKRFDFSSLTTKTVPDFLEYIGYAYNYTILVHNKIDLYKTFRLVANDNGKTKEFQKELSYAPLDLVRQKNLFNRASSPQTTVFYSSESIDTTFKELRPKPHSIVTLGIWEPIDTTDFLSYPIMANGNFGQISPNAKSSLYAYTEMKKKNSPLLGKFLDGYFNVLTREYSKSIKDRTEYLVSAYFSEQIFKQELEGWNFDCIVYPSVASEFSRSNFAFKTKTVDSRLKLTSAIEYEVLETYYDTPATNHDPLSLSVAKAKIIKKSKRIEANGLIIWA